MTVMAKREVTGDIRGNLLFILHATLADLQYFLV